MQHELPVNYTKHPKANTELKHTSYTLLHVEGASKARNNEMTHKQMCFTLAQGRTDEYRRLYEETDFVEVYEMDAIRQAYEWNR